MKAIVLAAGFGTRLLPLSEECPKILFPILNKPSIALIANSLKSAGVEKLGMNLHYLPDKIKDYLGKGEKIGMEIEYKFEEKILETGGGVANFASFIGDQAHFIVYNCDILSTIDMEAAFEFHCDRNPLATLVVVDNPPFNNILIDRYNRIKDVRGRLGAAAAKGDRQLCGAGIFIYNNEIFEWLPSPKHPYPMLPQLLKIIGSNPGSIIAYQPKEKFYWKDIGSTVAYMDIHRDILTDKKVHFHGLYKPSDGIWVDHRARVGENTTFEGFVSIGKGAEVGDGATLKNCIVWENAKIPAGSKYYSAIITASQIAHV